MVTTLQKVAKRLAPILLPAIRRFKLDQPHALLRGKSPLFVVRRSAHYAIHPRQFLRRVFFGREALLLPSGGGPMAAFASDDDRILANHLFHEGVVSMSDPTQVARAANLIQCASDIAATTQISIVHAAVCLKMGQNDRATEIYRRAFVADPTHRDLRASAGFHLFRHGTAAQIEEYSRSVLAIDSEDALAGFMLNLQERFPAYVEDLVRRIGGGPPRPTVIAVALWGKAFVETFTRYTLASLLAPNNIPALRDKSPVHLAIFTTAEDARALRADPLCQEAAKFASLQFLEFDPSIMRATRLKSAPFPDVARFALMSFSHYAALEAGRRADAVVVTLGADNIVSDGFLPNALKPISEGRDVVVVAGFRLPREGPQALIESKHRTEKGVLCIPPRDVARLLGEFLPQEYFVESRPFTSFPLFLCWRAGPERVLVRASHYMPCAVRAGAIKGPLYPSIDPIDGGFVSRCLAKPENMHISGDMNIALFEISDHPLVDERSNGDGFSVVRFATWILEYWNPLREPYLKQDLYVGEVDDSPEWERPRRDATRTVEMILSEIGNLSGDTPQQRSWQIELPSDRKVV